MRSQRVCLCSNGWRAVVWSSRVRRNRRECQRRETPQPEPRTTRHRREGNHNLVGGRSRDSEWPIVVRTRGNARRAKEPPVSCVFRKGGRSA